MSGTFLQPLYKISILYVVLVRCQDDEKYFIELIILLILLSGNALYGPAVCNVPLRLSV